MDDLLYGSNKGAPQRRPPAFDESWARPGQNFHAHSQSDAAYRPPTDLNDSFYSQVPVRSRSAKSQIRKKHSLSPHRPHMTTSTMIKSLQSEFNHSQTTSSSTGRSTGSEVSHSSMLSPRNQLELLDQMDYYRSTMTRNEAEKVMQIVLRLEKNLFVNFSLLDSKNVFIERISLKIFQELKTSSVAFRKIIQNFSPFGKFNGDIFKTFFARDKKMSEP